MVKYIPEVRLTCVLIRIYIYIYIYIYIRCNYTFMFMGIFVLLAAALHIFDFSLYFFVYRAIKPPWGSNESPPSQVSQ